MRQVKRLIYFILLNIVISAVTVVVVLNIWERNHPPLSVDKTPMVIVVTPTQSETISVTESQTEVEKSFPTDTGIILLETPAATPSVKMVSYQVKEGDTLGGLAVQFKSSVADIMTVNGLTDPDSLYVGQILHIPTEPLPTSTSTSTPTATATVTSHPSETATQGPTATATNTPLTQEPQVIISTVIGVGVLANERVVLQRTGDGELSLAGWRLEDGLGNTYDFPQLTLYKGGTINLNTRSGENSVLDLFWGKTTPVWKVNKTVLLYDARNELRASYTIP